MIGSITNISRYDVCCFMLENDNWQHDNSNVWTQITGMKNDVHVFYDVCDSIDNPSAVIVDFARGKK